MMNYGLMAGMALAAAVDSVAAGRGYRPDTKSQTSRESQDVDKTRAEEKRARKNRKRVGAA